MLFYETLKTIHILSATILFGSGVGIAFFMFNSWFTDNLSEKYFAARITVRADKFLTLPSVIIQPVSGALLIWYGGYNWLETWLVLTYGIYFFAGICWLIVLWLQREITHIVMECQENGTTLPRRYDQLFKTWTLLGIPAFIGLIAVFYLMAAKPG